MTTGAYTAIRQRIAKMATGDQIRIAFPLSGTIRKAAQAAGIRVRVERTDETHVWPDGHTAPVWLVTVR